MIANITHFKFFFRSDWKLDISWLKTKTTIPIGFQYRTLLQLCYRASGLVKIQIPQVITLILPSQTDWSIPLRPLI